MKLVSFNSLYKYFTKAIIDISNRLYTNGEISNDIKYLFFNNTGEYIDETNNENNDDIVLVNILNNGGITDSTISIDTYLQMIQFEILALDDYREDIMTIFDNLVAEYKTKVDQIKYNEEVLDIEGNHITDLEKTAAIQITMSDFPRYEEKIDLHGYDKFVTRLNTNIIVFPNANLSNQYILNIEGSDILYNSMAISRTTETTADLVKTDNTKFYPNTTGFQLNINGLFVDNPALNILLEDCANNAKFNQTYNIKVKKGDKLLFDRNFYCKDSRFDFNWGTIVKWSATFFIASVQN